MGEFTIVVFTIIGIVSLIMVMLALAIVSFGNLIEITPDGLERRGERIRDETFTKALTSPKNMSRVYALVFSILFIIGCIILLLANESKVIIIIGSIIMFSALLFSSTIVAFEMMVYRAMQANLKNFKNSLAV